MSEQKTHEKPIIIKRIKKGGGGHHGGAWKVAYADFVTAMMAFFLLLWLLNVATEVQKDKISNYFDPTNITASQRESGSGGAMGGLSISEEGAMVTNVQSLTNPEPTGQTAKTKTKDQKPKAKTEDNQSPAQSSPEKTIEELKKELKEKIKEEERAKEQKRFEETKAAIEEAIKNNPELAGLAKNLLIDITSEGLRIQIIDQDGNPLFPSGSANMFEKTQKLLLQVAKIIIPLPNHLSIRGHTDSVAYSEGARYTNWELSSDRANSSRRVLLEGKLPPERIHNVMGRADTDHLFKDNPKDPRNRRISMTLLKEEITHPEKLEKIAEEKAAKVKIDPKTTQKKEAEAAPIEEEPAPYDPLKDANVPPPLPLPEDVFKQTPGKVQFP